HAARLAKVDRLEVVAVDDRRGVGAALGDAPLPGLVLVHRRGPGDVVDRARAGNAALVGLVVEVEAAPVLAPNLPPALSGWVELERLLEELAALFGIVRVGPHTVEALQRQLARHLRVVRDQGLVLALAGDQRVPQPFGIAEGEAPVRVVVARDALVSEATFPEVDRVGRRDAPADGVHHPRARAAHPRARVLEERDVVSRRAFLVAVEQVVDSRIVLVDALLDEAKAEDAGVEVDVLWRVARDRRGVVDAVKLHAWPQPTGCSSAHARGAPRGIEHAREAADPHGAAAVCGHHHQPAQVALPTL